MVICNWISRKGALSKMCNKKIKEYIFDQKLDIANIIEDFAGYVFVIIRNSKYNFNTEDIEEIASDVFLVMWQNQKKIRYKQRYKAIYCWHNEKFNLEKAKIYYKS